MKGETLAISGAGAFGPDDDDAGPFVTPGLKQRIDLVHHLLHNGRQLVVLSGVSGAGKTAVLKQVQRDAPASWQSHQILAGPAMGRRQLVERLADAFSVTATADGDDIKTLAAIQERLARIESDGQIPVLIVDDAHSLRAEALTILVQLSQTSEGAPGLRLLMTADPARSAVIENLQRELEEPALLHVVELPRFSPDEVAGLIAARLAGYGHGDAPFAPADIDRIWKESDGLPGKVCTLVRQALTEPRPPRQAPDWVRALGAAVDTLGVRQLALYGALGLIGLLLGVALWPDRPSPEPDLVDLPLPELERARDNAGTTADDQGQRPLQPRAIIPLAIEEPDAAGSAVAERLETLPPLAEPIIADIEPVGGETDDGAAKPEATPPRIEERTATPAPAPVAKVEPRKPAPSPSSGDRYSIAWLQRQAADSYVLQLFGVRDRAAANSFIAKHGIGARSAILDTVFNGKPWHVVLYGHYPTRDAAQRSADSLPAALKALKPWARRLETLAFP